MGKFSVKVFKLKDGTYKVGVWNNKFKRFHSNKFVSIEKNQKMMKLAVHWYWKLIKKMGQFL